MNIESFRAMVVAFLSDAEPSKANSFAALKSDEDFLGSGLVDSHMFINLCLAIEEKTGAIIDLGELDPEEFSTIVGLHGIVGKQAA